MKTLDIKKHVRKVKQVTSTITYIRAANHSEVSKLGTKLMLRHKALITYSI